MRVLLLTRDDPHDTLTGVAVYVRDLGAALAREGHEVRHLYPVDGPPRSRFRVRRAMFAPRRPAAFPGGLDADVVSPALLGPLVDALEEIHPDVLHVHDLSGIPASLIPAAKARRYPVAVTLHDFWPFCRQLLLIRPGLAPCLGTDGGRNCAAFCSSTARPTRRLLQRSGVMAPLLRAALRRYRRLQGRPYSQFLTPAVPQPQGTPDRDTVQAYSAREARMREALLAADCLLAPSRFAKEAYVRHGYPAERIRVLSLSLLSFDRIARRVRSFRGYPIRFGYLGRVVPWKGAHVLAHAIRDLRPGMARFTFYGAVDAGDRAYLTSLSGAHPDLRFAGRYSHAELAGILDEIDVAIFPSLQSETLGFVGVEVQAAGVPVIGSGHAAIAEYVHHEDNGLLFPPGDTAALRSHITRILREPGLIGRYSARAISPPRMDGHVREIIGAYAQAAGHADLIGAHP